jgi:hypothetical protein
VQVNLNAVRHACDAVAQSLPSGLGAAGFRVRKSLLNPFDGFDAGEQRLEVRRVLDHKLGLAVDGQGQLAPAPL